MSSFNFLSGTVRVKANAPENWKDLSELPFWEDPNSEEWGKSLCRVLYHESIHFWQVLSSGYIANLVAEEWRRLKDYEASLQLQPQSENLKRYTTNYNDIPFTNRELVEAWARYWDIHTRSPARIMREENIQPDDQRLWEITLPGHSSGVSYTNVAFDLMMQIGPDCKLYGRPYRWLLDKFHLNSEFVSFLFPVIAHASFGSPNPALLFCSSFETAWSSKQIHELIRKRTGTINVDWLDLTSIILKEAVYPSLRHHQFPNYTSGFDVIERGILGTHPIYREYLDKATVKGFIKMYTPVTRGQTPLDLYEKQALVMAVESDSITPYVFPGQPFYRRMLGILTPPPLIRFDNIIWSARRPVLLKVKAMQEGHEFFDTFFEISNDLERRIQRFRAAEKAVSLGLPASSFERR